MILLIRFFLISLIVYLIVRSFTRYGNTEESLRQKPEIKPDDIKSGKKISKEIGEYVDYEEVDN